MTDEKKMPWDGAQMVPVDMLVLNDWNPNAMSELMFNELCAEIERDGFDEPILAAPLPGGKYRVVNGEHRYRAARVLGLASVPIVVKAQWTEEDQMIKSVRRNMLRGELDSGKFNKLINDLVKRTNGTHQKIAQMAVVDPALAKKLLEQQTAKSKMIEDVLDETQKEVETVDDLSFVLNTLIQEFGDSIPYDYLYFVWKQKMHMMVRMDSELKTKLDKLSMTLKDKKVSIDAFLKKAIDLGLKEYEAAAPQVLLEAKK